MSGTGDRTPAYVSREVGAAELCISVDTWDAMVKLGKLPKPVLFDGAPRWSWAEVDGMLQSLVGAEVVGNIYFVGFGNYVKIGFTVNPIKYRLAGLQTGAPEELEVYAVIAGTAKEERALHARFADLRAKGEWFRHEGDLAKYIAGLPK